MQAISTADALAYLEQEAELRYGDEATWLKDLLLQLAQDMGVLSAVIIPDEMLGELG